MRPGDVVRVPPGAKHRHGASPTTAMTHIAIVEHQDGRSTDWMEEVCEAQYSAPIGAERAHAHGHHRHELGPPGWMTRKSMSRISQSRAGTRHAGSCVMSLVE